MPATDTIELMPFLFLPIDPKAFKAAEGDDDKIVSDIQICMTGEWEHPWYGAFEITPKHLREMQRNFKESAREVVVDYQHSSLSPDPDEAIAAGWVDKGHGLKIKNGGAELWARVEWTQAAAERIRAKEYRFISPEIDFDHTLTQAQGSKKAGEKSGATLFAVAITNRPFLEGMAELELTAPVVASGIRFNNKKATTTQGGSTMNEDKIRELLELEADAEVTQEHRDQALELLLEQAANVPETPETPETPEGDPVADPEVEPVLASEPGGHVSLSEFKQEQQKREALERRLAFRDAEAAFNAQLGKSVIPAQRDVFLGTEDAPGPAVTNPAWFSQYCESAPDMSRYFTVIGGNNEGGASVDKVQAFVDQQKSNGKSAAEALTLAQREFDAETFNEWRYRKAE